MQPRSCAKAAEAAGRDPSTVTIAIYVRARVGDGPEGAGRRALRAAAGEYASYPAYARQFALMGLESEAGLAAVAHRAGRPQDVPETLIRAVAIVGEEGPGRDRLRAYRDAGADVAVVYPVVGRDEGPTVATRTLVALAPGGYSWICEAGTVKMG